MIPDDPTEDLQRFETPEEAFHYLRYVGTQEDGAIDLGEAALALALVFLPGLNPDRYRHHLKKLGPQLLDTYAQLRKDAAESLPLRVAALRRLIHDTHGYSGDQDSYDDLQNASIIRVIERRKGLPVALSILYIVAARGAGWQIDGLAFPGHFLVRMEWQGERAILDPFRGGAEMNAAELRQMLKSVAGSNAELSHQFYAAVSDRDILIRLQNNLKKRLIDAEDYGQAVVVLETMQALAPAEYRTLFDKGVLYAKLGQKQQARQAFLDYVAQTPDGREKHEALSLLQQIERLPD